MVTNSAGSVTSNSATLTVNGNSTPPVFTTNPAALTVTTTTNVGRLINLSVNAVAGSSGNQLMTVGLVSGGGAERQRHGGRCPRRYL